MKNILKYASLLMAAAMLFSCEGNIDNGDGTGTEPTPGPVNPGTDGDVTLVLTPAKNVVQTFGGDYIDLTVTLGDEQVTEGVTFYEGKTLVEVTDFKYATTEAGEHKLKAAYGTYISEEIIIRAVNCEIPATPADPNPERTDFKARILLSQFTTTGCGPCADMKQKMHDALADDEFAGKVILTACHSGLVNTAGYTEDPSYIKTNYDSFCQTSGFPFVNYDMYKGFSNIAQSQFTQMLNEHYDSMKDSPAGIAVNAIMDDNKKVIVKATIKAAQAGPYRIGAFLLEDGIIGKQNNALTATWMNTHDGVIRYIDSKTSNSAFWGYPVGNLEVGDTADYVFEWDLVKIWTDGDNNARAQNDTNGSAGPWTGQGNEAWTDLAVEQLKKDLHVVVFASTEGPKPGYPNSKTYYVNNAVDVPIHGQTPYEYR